MKLALRRAGYQPYELIKQDAFSHIKHTTLAWLEQASQFFVKRLIADAEPRIWYSCDVDGNLWWHAHDAVTGRSLHDASEAEMRAWIEQRHHPARS